MDALVTIAIFGQPHEYAVVRARLESEGIFCHAQDENTVAAHPFYSHLVGGIKLQVRAEDRDLALSILMEAGALGTTDDPPEEGSTDPDPHFRPPTIPLALGKAIALALLALVLLALILFA